MRFIYYLVLCVLLACRLAEAAPTYYAMSEEARAYLSKPLAERRTEKRAMTAKVAPRQLSDGVPLAWTATGKTPYSVTVCRMTDGKVFIWTQVSDKNALSVFNLEIGFEYAWSVIDHAGKSVGSGQFTIADVPPRCVNVPRTRMTLTAAAAGSMSRVRLSSISTRRPSERCSAAAVCCRGQAAPICRSKWLMAYVGSRTSALRI